MSHGVLILIVGPSGAGKDTLLDAARAHFAKDGRFVFPRRIVTRADLAGEEHDSVSREAFEDAARRGEYFLHWHAHGLGYAIPGSALSALKSRKTVVVNVSRKVVQRARDLWPRTEVVSISVTPAVLRERLEARGRETAADIEARLTRATDESCAVAPPFHTIDNSQPLVISSREFVALLAALSANPGEAVAAEQLEGATV